MATLAMGSGAARLIGVGSIPILTRLYGPEDFGVMAVFTALVSILAPLLTLRYVLALPLPRHDGLAMNLMALSAGLLVVMGTSLGIGLALFADPLLRLLSMEVLAPWWWLIVIALIGSGLYELLSLWATRRRAYKAIARTQITQSAAGAVVKIGFGVFGAGPVGLLVGQLVAKSSGIGTLLRLFYGEFRSNWRFIRWSRVKRIAARHRGFPSYRLPSQLLLVFSMQAPFFFVAAFYEQAIVGQLALALMVLSLPVSLLSGAMAKAFYAEIAPIARQRSALKVMAISVAKRTALLSFAPTLLIILTAPILFPLIFGEEWVVAGWLAAILGLYVVPQFVSQTLIQVLTATDRNHIFLYFNISRAALTALTLILPPILGADIFVTVATYSIAIACQRLIQSYSVVRLMTKDSIDEPLKAS